MNHCIIQALQDNKEIFVTERAIQQYFGLIKNNLVMYESRKHSGKVRERKLFYQVRIVVVLIQYHLFEEYLVWDEVYINLYITSFIKQNGNKSNYHNRITCHNI